MVARANRDLGRHWAEPPYAPDRQERRSPPGDACVRGRRMRPILTILLSMTIAMMGMLSSGGPALGAEAVRKSTAGSPGEGLTYHEICCHVSDMVRKGGRIGTNPARELGLYEDLKPIFSKYQFTDNAMSVLGEMQGYVALVSTVDIDNDGVEELWFRYTVGSTHCEDNYFFKRSRTGKYEYLKEEGLDQTGGRLCSGGGVSFFRHKGHNYLFVYSSREIRPETMALYSARGDGFHYECTVKTVSEKVVIIEKDESPESGQ
jgi:hypothetical protein